MSKMIKTQLKSSYDGFFGDVKDCVIVDIQGLPSQTASEFRAHLRENDIQMRVVLNRVAKKTFEGSTLEPASELLKGMTAVLSGGEDVVTLTKLLMDWKKKNKNLLEINGGFVDGQLMDKAGIGVVSKLPGKFELRGKIVSCLAGSMMQLLRVIHGPGKGLLYALNARQEKLEEK